LQELDRFVLLGALGFFGDGKMMKGDPELRSDRFEVGVVADDKGNVRCEFPGPLSEQQVIQAVIVLGYENRRSRSLLAVGESPAHSEAIGDFTNGGFETGPVGAQLGEVELDALKKLAGNRVGVLVGVEDVRTMTIEHLRERSDKAFSIGAANEKSGGLFHGASF
jgi:hypothetical protein